MGPSPVGAGTRPCFALRKTWLDRGPGVQMVQLHYAWSRPGEQPHWTAEQSRVLTPTETAGLRSAVIELPRELDGSREYLLHHFFFVLHDGGETTSPVVTEEIVAREVTYTDPTGRATHVGIVWGVCPPDRPDLPAPNYTTATPDPADPRSFRGTVWGPRGFPLRYGFHLARTGEDGGEIWDDGGGGGWTLTL